MKIDNIRRVKANLNRIVNQLASEGSVVITKDGRPCAVLMPITDDTDLEAVALAQSKTFWRMFDAAAAHAEQKGWTRLGDL